MNNFTEIDERYYPAIGRIFSSSVLNDLMSFGRSDYLDEVIKNSGIGAKLNMKQSLLELFEGIFELLSKKHCNEYIYKNALTSQIYLKEHSLDSHILTELRVGSCKADVVILNGTSTVYEIKSDLDTFNRLDTQLAAYSCFFDKIYVISSEDKSKHISDRIDSSVGIMALNTKGRIKPLRSARSNRTKVSPAVIFGSLRKTEYLCIIKDRFGFVPDVPNTRIHQECLDLFCELPPKDAHDAMLGALKKRRHNLYLKEFVKATPNSLRACAASLGLEQSRMRDLHELIHRPIDTVFARAES